MAQCIGRKGEGRNVLEGRNDLALLLDVDTVLCKLSVYCVELFCCNFSPSRIDGQMPVGMLFLFIVDGSKCRWVHDSPGDEKLRVRGVLTKGVGGLFIQHKTSAPAIDKGPTRASGVSLLAAGTSSRKRGTKVK